jgi:type II secretory ATPase GspE/PulE/Tfp pilus assembly ATPase PilB-like protein
MTGHKVFTTLHTNDALGSIPRLLDIGVAPGVLAGSLNGVIAQRLARRLCRNCKEEYTATPEECKILGVYASNPPKIHRAKGCPVCSNKGYKGRVALHEIMPIDKGFDELIATGSTRRIMMQYLLENGFVPMVQDAAEKVLQGVIDIEEMAATVDITDRM